MLLNKTSYKYLILFAFLLFGWLGFSQNNKQKELETRKQEIQREIQKINALRIENKSKEKSELSLIEDFNYKIKVLNNLIKVTNQQTNFLSREINNNQKKITSLRKELTQLKEDYAAMIVKSYKSKNEQSRIMFLLSYDYFKQAYKRLQYIKQYSNHQKEQGETIKAKTQELQQSNIDLLKQQEDKNKLISDNKEVQKTLKSERKEHDVLMKYIQKDLNRYTAQIKQKQREADRIDREIDNIIKATIAASNKKAGKASSAKTFALTPAGRSLAKDFESNKGKLNWPVDRGIVSLGYGTQPSPINKTLMIKSSGVRITTQKGAKVKAVFNGEVVGIAQIKNASLYVVIRHGNYFTVYNNLAKVYVKKEDKVTTNQDIGEVYTNPSNGETILSFIVSKDGNTQNPANWIYKM